MGSILGGIADIFGATNATQQGNADSNAANQDTQAMNQIFGEIQGNEGYLGGALSGVGNDIMGAESGFGQAGGFYGNEMMHGMDPAVSAAAFNQFDTTAAQNINNIRANYTGPNAAGLMEDLNLQDVQGREQLAGNLAAQNQGIMNQGAQGLVGTGEAAGGLGLQTFGAANAPLEYMGNAYGGAAQSAMGAAQTAYNTASNDWSGAAQGIGNGIASVATGGLSGLGIPGLGGSGDLTGGISPATVNTGMNTGYAQNALPYTPNGQIGYGTQPTYAPFGGGGGASGLYTPGGQFGGTGNPY